MRFLLFIILFIGFGNIGYTQYEDIIFEDYVYVTNIKTVTFHPTNQPLAPPVTYLNNSQGFQFSFDDLDNELRDYSYEIIHLNKDWTELSGLEPLEYIDGFQNEEIDNSFPSINTFIPYIHYQLNLPNDDLSWLISGNYLLIIYEGNEEDDRVPVVTRRFVVVDRQVSASVNVRRPLEVKKLKTHQEFDLFVSNKEFPILDPVNNITVAVVQNYRWDTAIENLKPRFVTGDQMTIDNTGKVSFPALKEFRQADIRSFDFPGIGVHSIDLKNYGTDVVLDLRKPRKDFAYTTTQDANGNFVVENKDLATRNYKVNNINSDYANMVFTLEMPEIEDEVYITGKMTDYKPDEMYRMRYYEEKQVYIGEILLKQGYYNFLYGVDNDGHVDVDPIEGSWYETENDYQVFVYLREPGDRYDRLVGYYFFNSNR